MTQNEISFMNYFALAYGGLSSSCIGQVNITGINNTGKPVEITVKPKFKHKQTKKRK